MQEKRAPKVSFLLGLFFIFIALDYFTFAFISLGRGNSFDFLLSLTLMSLVLLSYVMLRRGELNQQFYEGAKYAKAPKYPLKLLGAIALSLATMLSAYFGEYGVVASLMFGLSVFGGWYLYYGFDATEDKLDGYESDASAQRIITLILESQTKIENIQEYARNLHSKDVASLMQGMADGFSKIVEHVEYEPDDYEVARKYLVSYLGELASMSETFYKLDIKDKSESMKAEFCELLETSIEKLNTQYEKLLDDDILDLDIKMSVMKKRFKNEG